MSYDSDSDSDCHYGDTYSLLDAIQENTMKDQIVIEAQRHMIQKRNNRIQELETTIGDRSWVCSSMFFLAVAVATLAYLEGTALGMYICPINHR
jgi:hypothetical protein